MAYRKPSTSSAPKPIPTKTRSRIPKCDQPAPVQGLIELRDKAEEAHVEWKKPVIEAVMRAVEFCHSVDAMLQVDLGTLVRGDHKTWNEVDTLTAACGEEFYIQSALGLGILAGMALAGAALPVGARAASEEPQGA